MVESVGVAIIDNDKSGMIKQHNHITCPTENNGGKSKNPDIAWAKETVTTQHNQNWTQFHRHFM